MPKNPIATLEDPNYVYGMGRISFALREEGIPHAFVGGTAVQALCCYLYTDKGSFSIKDHPAREHTQHLRPTDDYDIITLADERSIRRVLRRMEGDEVVGENIYETKIMSRGWKNPSLRIESTLQSPTDLRINFSVVAKDSKLLSADLYEEEITTCEEVEFRGNNLQVPVRIVNPGYILAAKIGRNHQTREGFQKDFYDAALILDAMKFYNTTYTSFDKEKITPDWVAILSYLPCEKIEHTHAFLRYMRERKNPDTLSSLEDQL